MQTGLVHSLQLSGPGVISIIGAGGKTSLMFQLAKELALSGKRVLTTTTTKIFMPRFSQSPFTIRNAPVEEVIQKSDQYLKQSLHFSAGSTYDPATGKLHGFSRESIDCLWQAGTFDWIIVEADGSRQKPVKATASHEPVVPRVTTHLILVAGLDAVGKRLNERHVHRAALFSQNSGLAAGKIMDENALALGIGLEIKKAKNLCHPLSASVCLNKADTPDRIRSAEKIAALLKTHNLVHRIITTSLTDESPVKSSFTLNPEIHEKND